MPTQYESESDTRVTTLLSGILDDARRLLAQQLTLFQVELKHELHGAIAALMPLLAGAAVLVAAGFVLALASGHFLHWLLPEVPLWACFASIGGAVALVGIALLFWGKSKLEAINPLPEKSMEGLKENIQWKTKTSFDNK